MTRDHVAIILEQWQHERPDIDSTPMGIIGRLSRLSRHIEKVLEENFQTYGLSGGTFDLLAALRRVGEPHTLTPTQLQGEMMLSSGATTHRIDLLEKEGYVARQADPDDRRGTLVKLTAKGLELVDRVLETHVATEKRLLEGLTDRERATLAELLGKLAVLYNM